MQQRMRTGALLVVVLVAALFLAVGTPAQQLGLPQSDILTISTERMFAESAFGRRIAREIESDSATLKAENARIAAELSAEEQELTRKRPTMEPSEFRVLANEFDEKVQAIRSTQDTKSRLLTQHGETARNTFFQAARPVLAALMHESGAGVILERSNVFLSADATDITDLAISRLDAAIGDGAKLQETKDQ